MALAWLGLAAGAAHGGELEREAKGDFSAVRLLNAGLVDGAWQAGIHVTLKTGWKTYWRVPGESGVPPQFDWSGSANAADIAVAMPVPLRFSDGNGDGIGYKTEVVFPVTVTPGDPATPVRLDLQMFYAVCNDICVPVQAHLGLDLSADTVSAADRFRLKLAANDVPKPAASQPVTVSAVRLIEDADGKPVLEVGIDGLPSPVEADIFAESGTTAYFRRPELVSVADGKATYRLMVDGVEGADALRGKPVRLTIAAGGTNIAHEALVQ
jgi:DsbC/DsbD-like thiol-disulfide interchange protein